jgi:hypothetical protein
MGPMPERIKEGDLVVIEGLFCGPPVERILILLTNDLGVIKIPSEVTALRNGQKFVAKLQPPCGTFHITAITILVDEDYPVTQEIHQIEVISPEQGGTMATPIEELLSYKTFNGISLELDGTMATSIEELLSYKTLNGISPQTFSHLKNICENILLTEQRCAEEVQNISSKSDYQVWQVILELDKLYQLYEKCFLAFRPFDQWHLLHFLPIRMWNTVKLIGECLCIHCPTRILGIFLAKAKSTLQHLIEIVPEFEESWNKMICLLQDVSTYIGEYGEFAET